tara:strand:- start:80968 stop:82410 length:1443 start_codon:yes stop_codon:yes gene_type:complete
MTTLQTHSVHNTRSADSVAARAQTIASNATLARPNTGGFADVLGAFTAVEPDEAVDQTEDSESTDESAADEESSTTSESKSDESGAKDAESGEVAVYETAEGGTAETKGEQSPKVESSADWSRVLTNAASINLADLATKQLEGQASTAKTDSQTVSRDQSPVSTQPKTTAEDSPFSTLAKQGVGRSLGVTSVQPQQGGGSQEGVAHATNGASAETTAAPKDQTAPKQDQNHTPQQLAQPSKAEVVQAVQSQAMDQNQAVKRSDGVKPIRQVDGVASESKAVGGSESSGKSGQGQSGLDLGDRSQQATKSLQQTKSTDDQALQRREVIAQVQRGLASIMNTKGGTMKIRLSPEHLGEVNIQLMTKDGHVSVKIEAEHEQTKNMLKDGLEGLRSAIEARGATVDSLTVDSKERSGFEQLLGQSDQSNDQQQHESGDRSASDNDQTKNASSNGDPDGSEAGVEADTSNQPQSIWTQLGLDAIA